ncbi:MAG: TldD/PmbA family protein [Lachnospiraceae bacterium]|nr:TldD/PmbA family protein [Lachnospiraceae bacterium]
MKAPFSQYLADIAPALKELAARLGGRYDYVSILSTDSVGFNISISQSSKSVSNQNMTTERGSVVRVCRDGLYSEAAFNEFDPSEVSLTADQLMERLDDQLALLKECGAEIYETDVLPDEPLEISAEKETEQLPENCDVKALVEYMSGLSDRGMENTEGALDVIVRAMSTHISKIFLTANRDMRQSYVFTEASLVSYAPSESGDIRVIFDGVSGCGGPEIIYGLDAKISELPKVMKDLVSAGSIEPGEYDIITEPGVTGLIAHEAFGHGVEMDMFVKGRALGAEYIGKRVGSDKVTMHEGALCDESVTAFVFDDEGTPAGDVTEIDHGILKGGICDALSALRLGVRPTGNGKRENYAHKVYTRMTNTVFDSGDDTLEDMIASIENGYLLAGMDSGMEDPKHWGIQCIINRGYEIRDGKLTGKVVAPVIMTGYVPDVLGSVSMASKDRRVDGNGACGKGYKEWVKVADGGPYLKMRARLG